MLEKISHYSLVSYLRYKRFIEDFKNDQRGVSDVVVAILLVLVSVLAVVFFWGNLKDFLESTWLKVTEQGKSIN